jgi:DNA-directed RNA polymerase alpha subunit
MENLEHLAKRLEDTARALRRMNTSLAAIQALSADFALTVADDAPLTDIGLPVRARKAALRVGAKTVSELCGKSADDLLETKNFGEASLAELETCLARYGRSLRTEPAQ